MRKLITLLFLFFVPIFSLWGGPAHLIVGRAFLKPIRKAFEEGRYGEVALFLLVGGAIIAVFGGIAAVWQSFDKNKRKKVEENNDKNRNLYR